MIFLWELVAVAVGTYVLRASVIVAASRATMAPRVESTLRLIPPAVLSALVANSLFLEHGRLRSFGPWYVAAAIAGAVAVRTRSAGWTLLAGMVAVWTLSAVW